MMGLSAFTQTNGRIINQTANISPRGGTIRKNIESSVYWNRVLFDIILIRYDFVNDGDLETIEFSLSQAP